MSNAVLITGFNNWGKTTIIYDLFKRKQFREGHKYVINGVNSSFVVESHSNDDVAASKYIPMLKSKFGNLICNQHDLLAAFCPTREIKNDSKDILNDLFFKQFNNIYILYLENKWDYHAKLQIKEIMNHYAGINNVNHVVINADNGGRGSANDVQRNTLRVKQIKNELMKIFP
ncbi:hypothetical protein ABN764_25680 [Paenibacillaceae sp. P-4]|uniref:hypothetical protein n=1 Tax=Paenibacillaceae bacterium P-4 TaxID=3160969 RepID=UPI0032E81290